MNELVQVGKNTFFIRDENNVGIYRYNNNDVILIDTSMTLFMKRKIMDILKQHSWNLKGIINTHSHADHIGNDYILQKETNCKIYSTEFESSFMKHTILEPAFIYGANPPKRLKKKFLMAKEISNIKTSFEDLPTTLDILSLPGHSYDMIGVKTDDDIYFLADSLFPKKALETFHIPTIYDIDAFYQTLEYLNTLTGELYIISHDEPLNDITDLIETNKNKIDEILNVLCDMLKIPLSLNVITKKMFDHYRIEINFVQYHLVENTLKAMLTYLIDKRKIEIQFKDNFLLYKLRKNQ